MSRKVEGGERASPARGARKRLAVNERMKAWVEREPCPDRLRFLLGPGEVGGADGAFDAEGEMQAERPAKVAEERTGAGGE